MTNNLLKGKRIALLGGIGSRGEAREALIKELELAELEWVYGEKNTVKAYSNFAENLAPNRYDYIFVLTKFINHKIWDTLKAAKIQTPMIMVNGSYNSQNFLNAFIKQTGIKPEEPEQEEAKPVVFKKVLEAAKPDTLTPTFEESMNSYEPDELKRWRALFDSDTPEQAKKKLENKFLAQESMIAKLKANQQDQNLLKRAHRFHTSVAEFLQDMPLPQELIEAGLELGSKLKKYEPQLDGDVAQFCRKTADKLNSLALNVLLLKGQEYTISISKDLSENAYDRYGACIFCKNHKSRGCPPTCEHYHLKQLTKELEKISSDDFLSRGIEELIATSAHSLLNPVAQPTKSKFKIMQMFKK